MAALATAAAQLSDSSLRMASGDVVDALSPMSHRRPTGGPRECSPATGDTPAPAAANGTGGRKARTLFEASGLAPLCLHASASAETMGTDDGAGRHDPGTAGTAGTGVSITSFASGDDHTVVRHKGRLTSVRRGKPRRLSSPATNSMRGFQFYDDVSDVVSVDTDGSVVASDTRASSPVGGVFAAATTVSIPPASAPSSPRGDHVVDTATQDVASADNSPVRVVESADDLDMVPRDAQAKAARVLATHPVDADGTTRAGTTGAKGTASTRRATEDVGVQAGPPTVAHDLADNHRAVHHNTHRSAGPDDVPRRREVRRSASSMIAPPGIHPPPGKPHAQRARGDGPAPGPRKPRRSQSHIPRLTARKSWYWSGRGPMLSNGFVPPPPRGKPPPFMPMPSMQESRTAHALLDVLPPSHSERMSIEYSTRVVASRTARPMPRGLAPIASSTSVGAGAGAGSAGAVIGVDAEPQRRLLPSVQLQRASTGGGALQQHMRPHVNTRVAAAADSPPHAPRARGPSPSHAAHAPGQPHLMPLASVPRPRRRSSTGLTAEEAHGLAHGHLCPLGVGEGPHLPAGVPPAGQPRSFRGPSLPDSGAAAGVGGDRVPAPAAAAGASVPPPGVHPPRGHAAVAALLRPPGPRPPPFGGMLPPELRGSVMESGRHFTVEHLPSAPRHMSTSHSQPALLQRAPAVRARAAGQPQPPVGRSPSGDRQLDMSSHPRPRPPPPHVRPPRRSATHGDVLQPAAQSAVAASGTRPLATASAGERFGHAGRDQPRPPAHGGPPQRRRSLPPPGASPDAHSHAPAPLGQPHRFTRHASISPPRQRPALNGGAGAAAACASPGSNHALAPGGSSRAPIPHRTTPAVRRIPPPGVQPPHHGRGPLESANSL